MSQLGFMSDIISVFYNDSEVLQYDRGKPLPIQQQAYLSRMDRQMDGGIELHGQAVAEPDTMQRAEFVAGQLADAIYKDDDARAAAMCTYLAKRLPDLKAVKIREEAGKVAAELVVK